MHRASHSRKVITFKSTSCNIISLHPLLLKQIFPSKVYKHMHLSFSDEELSHELCHWPIVTISLTTCFLWMTAASPSIHLLYSCTTAGADISSACNHWTRLFFQDEVGTEMSNALIGREGKISLPLPQHLWFLHADMHNGAFNMYNHMSKLKLCVCARMLFIRNTV